MHTHTQTDCNNERTHIHGYSWTSGTKDEMMRERESSESSGEQGKNGVMSEKDGMEEVDVMLEREGIDVVGEKDGVGEIDAVGEKDGTGGNDGESGQVENGGGKRRGLLVLQSHVGRPSVGDECSGYTWQRPLSPRTPESSG